MKHHREKPNLRPDQILCTTGLLVALGTGDWLLLGIVRDLDRTQPWRFLALVAALALALYLGWMLFTYARVEYDLSGHTLTIRRALGKLQIPMDDIVHLYRWRQRWLWSGGARAELGVDDIGFLPNTLLRMRAVWVIVYRTPNGERRAVGVLPSAALLSTLKAWAWEGNTAND